MLACFFLRNSLYELAEGTLEASKQKRLHIHLERCPECSRRLKAINMIISSAHAGRIQDPQDAFWSQFRRDLNTKLDERLTQAQKTQISRPQRRPYWGAVSLAPVLLMLLVVYVHWFNYVPVKPQSRHILEQVSLLEEMEPGFEYSPDEEAFIEEISLPPNLSL